MRSVKISAKEGEDMGAQIHQMTPLLPEGAEDLQDFSLEVIQKSAALGTADSIHVGASFVDGDFKSYKSLQTYLM
jgi:hypothetical protein